MKKKDYKTSDGREVTGYAVGEYLAVRSVLSAFKGPRDRKKCIELGQWQLEHVPTGYVIARGHYRAVMVALGRAFPEAHVERLAETNPGKLVTVLKLHCSEWVDLVHNKRVWWSLPGATR